MTDPLGLTNEQRATSDIEAWWRDLPERMERNRAAVEALPPGTVVDVPGYGPMTREHLLEVML